MDHPSRAAASWILLNAAALDDSQTLNPGSIIVVFLPVMCVGICVKQLLALNVTDEERDLLKPVALRLQHGDAGCLSSC